MGKRVKLIIDMKKFISYFILEDISKNVFNCLFFDMPETVLIRTEPQMNSTDPVCTSPRFALESIEWS